jgi:tetratricopeptide (TPR) repeat protein
VALLVDRAQGVRPDFQVTERNAGTVAALCARLEGIPLAIELLASRAQVLTPAQMLAHLDRRFDLLASRHRDAGGARHRTLRAALDWSYELLAPSLQRFFIRLSVFRGGWTLEAAEAVCDEPLALDYLAQLRECSLVLSEEHATRAGSGEGEIRFRMLETLREYGRENLQPGECSEIQRRHADYFLALAEEADPQLGQAEQLYWLDRLEREHDNLRAALDAWVALGELEGGLRLGAALARFWETRGHWSEGRERLQRVLTHSGAQARTRARCAALRSAGILACDQGDYATARALLDECLPLARELEEPRMLAVALNGLGAIAVHQGDFRAAASLFEESLAIRRQVGTPSEVASSLNNLGVVAWRQGDHEASRAFHEESLAIKREVGDIQGIAISLNSLGGLAGHRADWKTASALAEESLAIQRELGDPSGMAYALATLGDVANYQGDQETAQRYYEECLHYFREVGEPQGIAKALNLLGCMASQRGEFDTARAMQRESLALRQELGDKSGIAACLEGFASVEIEQGDFQRVARLLGAVAALREAVGAPLKPAEAADFDEAVAKAREALGETAFNLAWEAGRATSMEQAIAETLGVEERGCGSSP